MGYRNCATVRARGLVLGCKQLFHPKQPKQPIFNRNPNRGSVRWDPTSYSPCIQSSSAVPHASSSSNSTNTHSPFDSSLQNRQRPRQPRPWRHNKTRHRPFVSHRPLLSHQRIPRSTLRSRHPSHHHLQTTLAQSISPLVPRSFRSSPSRATHSLEHKQPRSLPRDRPSPGLSQSPLIYQRSHSAPLQRFSERARNRLSNETVSSS